MRVEQPVNLKPAAAGWGSDYLAEVMRALGLDYVALVPGASFRGLHDSLVNYLGNTDPAMLLALHEESAVAIAHGYAKVTGRPMGVILHSNVGLMHATMAIFNAFCDRAPMLIYGATGPMDAHARRPWIDWIHTCSDQAALIRHFIKWDNQPASLAAAAEAMLRASQIARTAPRGPTYVVFDSGLQEAKLPAPLALPDVARFQPSQAVHPSPEAVKEACTLLARARRPLILAGRVGRSMAAWNARIALAEALGARVLTDLKAAAAFPTDHPLHGVPIKYVNDANRHWIADADVILSLDWIDLAGTLRQVWKNAPVGARVVQVSCDPLVHNGWSMDHQGLAPADVNLLADPDAATPLLLAGLSKGRRRARVQAVPTGAPAKRARAPLKGERIGVRTLAEAVMRITARQPTTLVRVNVGWPVDMTRYNHPLDFLGNDGGGGVGSGPGLTVGAALALRDSGRLTLAVLGDGDYLMGVTAFWSAVRYGIALLAVVANNNSFFNDEMHQERMAVQRGRPKENRWIGQRIAGPDPDIAGFARAQGAVGIGPVTKPAELEKTLRDAAGKAMGGHVVVVDVRVAAEYDEALAKLMVRGEK